MARGCPSHVVLHRIGAHWAVFVINALEHGPMRFVELMVRNHPSCPR